jgi:hypothetical protein
MELAHVEIGALYSLEHWVIIVSLALLTATP